MDWHIENIYKHNHIDGRFPDIEIIDAFSILNKGSLKWPIGRQRSNQHKLVLLNNHYGPHNVITPDSLISEYPLCLNSVKSDERLSSMNTTDIMLFMATNDTIQANLAKMAAIGLLLPMSTADCERDFSTLQRVKTSNRNRLSNNFEPPIVYINRRPRPQRFSVWCGLWHMGYLA